MDSILEHLQRISQEHEHPLQDMESRRLATKNYETGMPREAF